MCGLGVIYPRNNFGFVVKGWEKLERVSFVRFSNFWMVLGPMLVYVGWDGFFVCKGGNFLCVI